MSLENKIYDFFHPKTTSFLPPKKRNPISEMPKYHQNRRLRSNPYPNPLVTLTPNPLVTLPKIIPFFAIFYRFYAS